MFNLIDYTGLGTSISPNDYGFYLDWLNNRPFELSSQSVPLVADRAPRLYFTIGAPRSGKSTVAQKWHRRAGGLPGVTQTDDNMPRYLWDTDLLRLELYGKRYYRKGDPMAYAIKNYAIRVALASRSDVVVAGTHSSKTAIRRILEISPTAIPVVIDTEESVCLERAKATGQEDLIPVIPRVCQQIKKLLEQGMPQVIAEILDDIKHRRPY